MTTITITLPRATVKQALEALELGYDSAKSEADQYHAAMAGFRPERHAQMDADVQQIAAAITALRAALAQQAEPVEPVAWRWGYRSVTTGEMDWRGYVEIAAHPNLRSPEIIMEPLYTAPPQRLPLTEEEIDALPWNGSPRQFARAVERAHGITDPQVADRLARHGIPMPEGDPK